MTCHIFKRRHNTRWVKSTYRIVHYSSYSASLAAHTHCTMTVVITSSAFYRHAGGCVWEITGICSAHNSPYLRKRPVLQLFIIRGEILIKKQKSGWSRYFRLVRSIATLCSTRDINVEWLRECTSELMLDRWHCISSAGLRNYCWAIQLTSCFTMVRSWLCQSF